MKVSIVGSSHTSEVIGIIRRAPHMAFTYKYYDYGIVGAVDITRCSMYQSSKTSIHLDLLADKNPYFAPSRAGPISLGFQAFQRDFLLTLSMRERMTYSRSPLSPNPSISNVSTFNSLILFTNAFKL
jgi:hypothetical protein